MEDKTLLNIDGAVVTNKTELHNTIAWQLQLPEYYGCNLDALWDVLSTWSQPLAIEVTNIPLLKDNLGDYADALLQVLIDAEAENSIITLKRFPV